MTAGALKLVQSFAPRSSQIAVSTVSVFTGRMLFQLLKRQVTSPKAKTFTVADSIVLQILPVDLIPEPTQHLQRTRRPLRVKQGEVSFSAGFQPLCVVQLHPPAVPTAMAVGANWGMYVVAIVLGKQYCFLYSDMVGHYEGHADYKQLALEIPKVLPGLWDLSLTMMIVRNSRVW